MSAPDPASQAPSFQDGVYRIRGFRLTMERYKSGKNQGKPKGVFLFHLIDDRFRDGEGRYRLVSQQLGWFPGWSVYDINFKLLGGMSREEFMRVCADRQIAPPRQLEFFNSLFKGVDFEAEVRKSVYNGREYLNVWKICQRLGRPDADSTPAASAPAAQPRRQGPAPGTVEAEINALVKELSLNRTALTDLLAEEFGVQAASDLDAEGREMLRDLLRERKRENPRGDGLPF